MLLWSHCFTSDVFWALCTSAYRMLLEDSEAGGLWIILFQSSSIHLFMIASSHDAFGWNVTLTLRSYCFFSEAFICNPFRPKVRRRNNVSSSAKLINWTVHWRFFEAWLTTSYLEFISNGFCISCIVIHDKRKWYLVHVCLIFKSVSFSNLLLLRLYMKVLNSVTQSCW